MAGFRRSYASVLAAILVISCVWYSLSDYQMPVFEIEVNAAETPEQALSKVELLERPDETPVVPQGSKSVAAIDDKNATYKDGTYYGTGTGFGGKIKVKVVIENAKIKSIDIVSNSETPTFLSRAKAVIKAILKKQSTNVDTVSGATYSSAGIIKAVRAALSKASTKKSESKNTSKSDTSGTTTPVATGKFPYPDGEYTGTAFGFCSDITVTVTIRNKTITKIVVVSQDETPEFYSRAIAVLDSIRKWQTVDVDTVSGATYSSNGLIGAVKAALVKAKEAADALCDDQSQAGDDPAVDPGGGTGDNTGSETGDNTGGGTGDNTVDGTGDNTGTEPGADPDPDPDPEPQTVYIDGSYTATAWCYYDEDEDFDDYQLTLTITIKNDKITDISNVSGNGPSSNNSYIREAVNGMTPEIIAKGSASGVDTVSGATCSSKAIIDACNAAMKSAKR